MAAKVKVVARLRPFISTEFGDDSVVVSPQEGTISVVNPRVPTERFKFHFSSCYDQTCTQEEIFLNEVRPLVNDVFEGLVCTIFAYGVTSSGKTHTIQGTPEQPGIIPRVVNALLEKKRETNRRTVSLSLSYMEIYKDEAYDLLVPRETAIKLPIREDPTGKIIVTNLTETPIASFQEFERLFYIACKGRSTGVTNLNHASSRSHAMLSLTVTCLDSLAQKALVGKINLVDLAGSENNKLTGNDPSRMAESSAINKSLTVLGQVVHALNTNQPRVPYRDSKLTRILQDALGGSAMGLLICNLAPGARFRQDTLNTLNFATRTKQVENKVMVNEKDMRPPTKTFLSSHAPSSLISRPANLLLPDRTRTSLGGPNSYHPTGIPLLNRPGFTHGGRSSLPEREKISEMGVKEELLDMDLDEKILKAVQQEVERRLAEREAQERERLKEIEEQERERAAERQRQDEEQRAALMRKHDELNRLLKRTLRKAEKENHNTLDENENEETTTALSPKRARKLGEAYVSLGREYLQSKEPDYNAALRFWQQAETYMPENRVLKRRIAELGVAIREGLAYKPKRSKGGNRLPIESPVPNSPSGSRDHKESRKRRLKARLVMMKERGEIDPALVRTPTPKKVSKKQDVFVDSDVEMQNSVEP